MKKTLRLLSLVLAILMLASSFVACTKNPDGDDEETVEATTDAVVEEKKLPDLNWDNAEFRILGRDHTHEQFDNFEVWREELPEDVVGKAVYNRNQALLDKYGIAVTGTLVSNNTSKATTMLESGDDLYEMIILPSESFHPLAMQGYLLDMYGLDYVNTDHEGWQAYANQQMGMGGRLFYTTNKFLLQDKHRSWMIYYNRELAQELKLGYFEDFVFDGTWTLDKVNELMKAASADSDGEVGMSKKDNWGIATQTNYSFSQLAYGAGFRLTETGSDGYPKLVGATDRIIQILDAVYEITTNTDCYYNDERMFGVTDENENADHIYWAGRALMLEMCVSALNSSGEKFQFAFGALPNPKFDEDQKNYYSIPNLKYGSLFAIPSTVVDPSFAGFGLQALTEESVATSYDKYIESKCKLQDAYDEDCAKCLDIIFEGVVYDIAFISDISGLGNLVWQTLGGSAVNTYARLYSRLERVALKEFERIRETYDLIP